MGAYEVIYPLRASHNVLYNWLTHCRMIAPQSKVILRSYPAMRTSLISPSRLKAIAGALCLVVLLLVLYRHYAQSGSYKDPALTSAITKARAIHSYRQSVETHVQFPNRSLQISGVYDIDTSHKNYSSVSTTTLFLPGEVKGAIFTQANFSIGSDVYVRISTENKALQNIIPATSTWQHFSANAIPSLYTGIAVSGPILDNLRIFEEKGNYLTQIGPPIAAVWGTEPMRRYSFNIDQNSATRSTGTLKALFGRITTTGTIEVWIDAENTIRMLHFANELYHSTTTLSDINADLHIIPPSIPLSER